MKIFKITNEEIIKAVKHALLVFVFAMAFTAMASWTNPTSNPPGGNADIVVTVGSDAHAKKGAFGTGITNQTMFDTDVSSGVTLETQGKAALGPTAIFGDLVITGSSIIADGLRHSDPAGIKPICVTQSGNLLVCP